MFLSRKASRARQKEAENARNERLEIVKALSQGQITRRELIKWGLISAAGALLPIRGLSLFGNSAFGSIPTGAPPSPLNGAQPFSQPMARFDVLPRVPATGWDSGGNCPIFPANSVSVDCFDPQGNSTPGYLCQPQKAAVTDHTYKCDSALGGGYGPLEGRPPGAIWSHQQWEQFQAKVMVQASQMGATTNTTYNPKVPSSLNSGINPAAPIPLKFHPNWPTQDQSKVWTFNGSVPPKLVQARYGEPLIFRHWNRLNPDVTKNGGFGRHTISTHEHNGHHGAENDGFTGAFFFPGQYYDYHWPIVHAGITQPQFQSATDPRCGTPDGNGGIIKLPGDWHETMSTHWFHDHMFSFTAQNVYKGNAAMFNLYSSLDRGNEVINDGVNLRLPSGRANDWGNLDYDVNLMVADKAFDANGQLLFDIADSIGSGFLGDVMTVNLAYKPYFEVERRKYRFRILNASVSRFFKICLVNEAGTAQPIIQIGNDGNLLPGPVTLTQLDEQGIAERYDIVIDFSFLMRQNQQFPTKFWLVNLCEHGDGAKPSKDLSVADALAGKTNDPCVGRFLEFRVVRDPAQPDVSQVPAVLIPNPDLSNIPVSRTRLFEFGSGASQTSSNLDTGFIGPWGVKTDNNRMLDANYGRISAAPKQGTCEVWTLKNGGGGWDHPIHIHFEEGQIIARNGSAANVPAWEKGRKDVYRLRPGGSVTIKLQFRDWGGMFMEHCHNTVHEDNAMLVRWDIQGNLVPLPTPMPTPRGVTFINPDEIEPTAF